MNPGILIIDHTCISCSIRDVALFQSYDIISQNIKASPVVYYTFFQDGFFASEQFLVSFKEECAILLREYKKKNKMYVYTNYAYEYKNFLMLALIENISKVLILERNIPSQLTKAECDALEGKVFLNLTTLLKCGSLRNISVVTQNQYISSVYSNIFNHISKIFDHVELTLLK